MESGVLLDGYGRPHWLGPSSPRDWWPPKQPQALVTPWPTFSEALIVSLWAEFTANTTLHARRLWPWLSQVCGLPGSSYPHPEYGYDV